MDDARRREAAGILAAAWLAAEPAPAFPEALRARDRAEAYQVQDLMAASIGEPVTGWKLGATSPAMRRMAGHDGPVIGRVFESVTHASPAELPARRYRDARVECEFAFRAVRDLEPRTARRDPGALVSCVDLHGALEIIGNRYPRGAGAFTPSTIDEIADNGAGIGFVFGPPIAGWDALDLQHLEIELRVDDGAPAGNFLGDDRCNPLETLADALVILGERGIAIAAGQYVSTGAATIPQPVAADSAVAARFAGHAAIEARFVP